MPDPHPPITIFRLIVCALPYALHLVHATLHCTLFFSPAGIRSFFPSRTTLYDQRSHFSHSFRGSSFFFSVPSLLRATAALPHPALLLIAIHCELHLPTQRFLFPSNIPCPLLPYTLHFLSSFSSFTVVYHPFYIYLPLLSRPPLQETQ